MRRLLGSLWMLVMGTLLFGCGWGRGALDGRIIDAAHESAPVPGAFVVIKRERGVFLSEGDVQCGVQELTTADSHGHFHFKSWWAPLKSVWDVIFPSEYFVSITVYKRGFTGGENFAINDKYQGVVVLEGRELTSDEELAHIREVAQGLHTCDNEYAFEDSTRPLIDALKTDAALVAETPKQLSDATYLLMSPAEAISLALKASPAPLIKEQVRPPPAPARAPAQSTATPR
jgi:hypothetical protein